MSMPTSPPPAPSSGPAPGYAGAAGTAYAGPRMDVSGTPPIPLTRLIRVELRKALDTRASFWLFIAVSVITMLIEGFFLLVGILANDPQIQFDTYTAPVGFVLQPALAVVTVMLVTSEWGQRTAMVTFSLEPRRIRVVAAKYIAGLALASAVVGLVIVVAFLFSALNDLFSPDNFTWSFSVGQILGLIVFEALAVSVGFAFATLILNTPAAIGAFPLVVYVVPLALGFVGLFWHAFRGFAHWVNFQTAQAPLADWSLDTGREWGRLIVVVLVWGVAPLVLGFIRVLRAEVK